MFYLELFLGHMRVEKHRPRIESLTLLWYHNHMVTSDKSNTKPDTRKKLMIRSSKEKQEIITYAINNGITRASQKYNVNEQDIRRWNQKYHLLTIRPKQVFTPEKVSEMLNRARLLMSENPIEFPHARAAFEIIAQENSTTISVLYNLNQKYKIIPVKSQTRSRRLISAAEKMIVQRVMDETHSVCATSRKTGISKYTITRIMRDFENNGK